MCAVLTINVNRSETLLNNSVFANSSIDEELLIESKVDDQYEEEEFIKKVQITVGEKTVLISNDPSIFHNDYDYDTNVFSDIDTSIYMRLASIRAKSDKTIQYQNEKIKHSVWLSKVRSSVRETVEKPTINNVKEKLESLYSDSLNAFKKNSIDFEMDIQNLSYLIFTFGNKLRHLLYILQTNKYLYE